jgi:hypothetical protein
MPSIRQIALQTKLKKQALFVPDWNEWIVLQELTGEQRADLLQDCTSTQKVGSKNVSKVNLKKLYPMLVVLSSLNPDVDTTPSKTDPNYSKYPGAVDETGNVLTPFDPDKPAGELCFSLSDIGPLNQTSGATLETISKPASILSGLREEDIEEKKADSGETDQSDTAANTGSTTV